ncbi:glycoside hydrolase family 25 protein [Streptococcus plurextorum]|uniref:glycoside hydrolase family 25 protein n=1 Tax=Streptococcus plurextorum TaxID=456876 RepID=UPI000489A795|nr:glycoside hydrolase family 25 protein [Streptococcus plurextorum]
MRKRIKPIFILVFIGFFLSALATIRLRHEYTQAQLLKANQAKAKQAAATETTTEAEEASTEPFVLNPIIDVSGWQLPSDIDYDLLSANISGAIVRVFGGSQITKDNNAAYTTGIDKSFKTHITEFQKRNVPVAVYSYALGSSVEEMKEEARLFYENASPYNPTFYWIDVEEPTMSNMNKGVEAFRKELKKLGAEKVGIYIGTYFMAEQGISVDKFDAVWIPAYGDNSGYYNAAPQTNLYYDLHQYTSAGWVSGFSGNLDLNQISPISSDAKATYEKLFGPIEETENTN